VFEYGAKRVGVRGQGKRKGDRGNCKGQALGRQTVGRQVQTDRHLLTSREGGGGGFEGGGREGGEVTKGV
jgi:hypothetical protein